MDRELMDKSGRIHFIGIGGIGMSGIAALFLRQGYSISGSDKAETALTKKLSVLGANIFSQHAADNINGATTVIYSSAIKEDNPELQEARARGLSILKRAQALAELMQGKTCIAVAGAHGKTTTTSLSAHLLLQAGLFPTAAIGGILRNLDDNAHLGESRYFVAEADESDGTFLYYNPDYSIITNVDREHLDHYGTFDNIIRAYKNFAGNTKDTGYLFCCGDDVNLRKIGEASGKRVIYFGISQDNDFYAKNVSLEGFNSTFDYYRQGKKIGRVNLPLAGIHNVSNALGVISLGWTLGINHEKIETALESFKGTERRFQLKCEFNGIKVIDDYGHHPAEVRATIKAAKTVPHKRLVVIFQPHRYSRTKFLMEDFSVSFSEVDYLALTDIYSASESPIPEVTSRHLCEKIKAHGQGNVFYLEKDKISQHLKEVLKPGDLVLTLGAGDIGKISDELVEWIKR